MDICLWFIMLMGCKKALPDLSSVLNDIRYECFVIQLVGLVGNRLKFSADGYFPFSLCILKTNCMTR